MAQGRIGTAGNYQQSINKAVEEVKLQEQDRAVLQHQKKELMQKLLTGKVRVNIK